VATFQLISFLSHLGIADSEHLSSNFYFLNYFILFTFCSSKLEIITFNSSITELEVNCALHIILTRVIKNYLRYINVVSPII